MGIPGIWPGPAVGRTQKPGGAPGIYFYKIDDLDFVIFQMKNYVKIVYLSWSCGICCWHIRWYCRANNWCCGSIYVSNIW